MVESNLHSKYYIHTSFFANNDFSFSLFVLGRSVFSLTTKDTRDLQTSTKRLVKEHSCLKLRHEREPSQESYRSEQKQTHQNLIASRQRPNR